MMQIDNQFSFLFFPFEALEKVFAEATPNVNTFHLGYTTDLIGFLWK